jgi:hypothetical protein
MSDVEIKPEQMVSGQPLFKHPYLSGVLRGNSPPL